EFDRATDVRRVSKCDGPAHNAVRFAIRVLIGAHLKIQFRLSRPYVKLSFPIGPVAVQPNARTIVMTSAPKITRALLAISLLAHAPLQAGDPKPSFTVGWSVYVGWNPYYYMGKSGILRKWADKYGINIRVQRFDYAPSLDAFVAKNIDACTM